MTSACVFNIQRYSIHDGGGIRSIVFLKGCPFTCPWCSNPESLSPHPEVSYKETLCMNCSKKGTQKCLISYEDCPTGAKELIGKEQTVDEVFKIVERDKVFYETSNGGVTISGGECLLYQDFTTQLLQKCKDHQIHTAIETTLGVSIKHPKQLVEVCDLFLVDFKIMDPKIAHDIIGISIDIFKSNIDTLLNLGASIIPRIPLIPGFTTTSSNIKQLIKYLKEKNFHEVHLLPFHKLGESKYQNLDKEYSLFDTKTFSDKEVNDIKTQFENIGFKVIIGGN